MRKNAKRMLLVVMVLFVGGVGLPGSVRGAEGLDGDRPLGARVKDVEAMLSKEAAGFGAPAADRVAWEKLAGKDSFKGVIADAEKILRTPIPEQSDDLYLDYSRTGNRTRWQRVSGRRRGRVLTLVLAECLENKGRFVGPWGTCIISMTAELTIGMSWKNVSNRPGSMISNQEGMQSEITSR